MKKKYNDNNKTHEHPNLKSWCNDANNIGTWNGHWGLYWSKPMRKHLIKCQQKSWRKENSVLYTGLQLQNYSHHYMRQTDLKACHIESWSSQPHIFAHFCTRLIVQECYYSNLSIVEERNKREIACQLAISSKKVTGI